MGWREVVIARGRASHRGVPSRVYRSILLINRRDKLQSRSAPVLGRSNSGMLTGS